MSRDNKNSDEEFSLTAFRLPTLLLARTDNAASDLGLSRSDVIRLSLSMQLSAIESGQIKPSEKEAA